ncbi:MAG: ShlB/FhaC/HecB family hemolysin secretion/activation protein [Methylacidiphilales bacterium]|nr:ShlB/FhaC/HecB family hemolysin secretion/activation protein [Candidatus Methylacidiphilales bacterium]
MLIMFFSLAAGFCGARSALAAIDSPSVGTTDGKAPTPQGPVRTNVQPQTVPHFFIREYHVEGARHLDRTEIEKAVYPYLGPYRTADDVEKARAALEKSYQAKGYQVATVQIAQQQLPSRNGVVVLKVSEGEVERLRINGSRYFSLQEIREAAPSLKEGSVIDYNKLKQDVVALNQLPDRRVIPALRAGSRPGTMDVDLNVEDKMPLHGNIDLNNRNSPDTAELRLSGGLSYSNLWQLGHTVGASFQIAPEDVSQVNVVSAYYLAPVPDVTWLKLMLQGTRQDSNVSTLGGAGVAGRGDIVGPRAIFILPGKDSFYHSLTLGVDYKHYTQDLTIGGSVARTPLTYYPMSGLYSATWTGKGWQTDASGGVTFNVRGLGSDPVEFNNNRTGANGSFVYFKTDVSHTRDLPAGLQFFGRVQGQAASVPLVSSEQFNGGGVDTARGYIESETLGDDALFGTLELRSPSLGEWLGKDVKDWRFYVFSDAGVLEIKSPLLEQKSSFGLASAGVGSRIKLFDHYNGSFTLGSPLVAGPRSPAESLLIMFEVGAEF